MNGIIIADPYATINMTIKPTFTGNENNKYHGLDNFFEVYQEHSFMGIGNQNTQFYPYHSICVKPSDDTNQYYYYWFI